MSEKNEVKKYTRSSEYEIMLNDVKKEQLFFRIINVFSYVSIIIILYNVFRNCISDNSLINIISLGAIIATFGSAILAISQVIERDRYNRILVNVDILFRNIIKEEPWRRWQFLKRTKKEKYLNRNEIFMDLSNPTIRFDIGSHEIDIYVPTVKEDFYDLPSLKCFFQMFRFQKYFKTNAYGKSDKVYLNSSFDSLGNYVLGWDCLYDIWKSVIIYRASRYLINIGCLTIFTSVLYTFFFEQICNLVAVVSKLIHFV